MELQNYHQNLKTPHVGCEKPRAYYIPFGSSMEAYNQMREKSDRFVSLSGKWSFAYFDRAGDIPENILSKEYELHDMRQTEVPSNWQLGGYDLPQYLSRRYPFPYDPPYVPEDTPAGVYLRDIKIDEAYEGFSRTIVFEGVDSCLYLYINGKFVGYSQGSHNMREFNIGEYLSPGVNRVAAVVLKWCDGSYLESQDKWRLSGIFREVYLLHRPRGHIRDYKVTAALTPDYRAADITVHLDGINPEDSVITLYNPEGVVLEKRAPDIYGQAVFTVESPLLWSAETPELYTVMLEYAGEFIPERVGIREVRIDEGLFKINGRAVKLKGVNRHEFDAKTGYVVSEENMVRDLMLMKRNNINAVRTAHYPPDPRFLGLCDKYGLYVIDEADLNCGGVFGIGGWLPDYNLIADDPEWEEAVLDRVSRMAERDKNRASVVIWSLGSEAGYGCNLKKAINWLRYEDPSRLIHYEGGFSSHAADIETPRELEIVSRMYESPRWCEDYCAGGDPRPLMLCAYARASGNGPGGLREYWEAIYKNPRFFGAFIWEWGDHLLLQGHTHDRRAKYAFGGDFGDRPNDGAMCADGLMSTERRPHPGLKELKTAIQPVKIEALDLVMGEFKITNLYDFIYLSRFECVWELTRYGKVVKSGSLGALPIPPGRSETIFLDYEIPGDGRCFIRICFKQLGDNLWTSDGEEMAFAQFELDVQPRRRAAHMPQQTLIAEDAGNHIVIKSEGFQYRYNRLTACFDSLVVGGRILLLEPMRFNIWRAPTDSDRLVLPEWREAGYDTARVRVYSAEMYRRGGEVVIETEFAFTAVSRKNLIFASAVWTVNQLGEISLECNVRMAKDAPYLPRFGLIFGMLKEYSAVEYFGLGPGESYIDKRLSSYMGRFSLNVRDIPHDYIIPQETGNRHATEWAAVYRQDKTGLMLLNFDGFDFSALPHTIREYERAKHNYELPMPGGTWVCADYMQSGVGFGAFGPMLPAEHRLLKEKFCFKLRIRPVIPNGEPLWSTALDEYAGFNDPR